MSSIRHFSPHCLSQLGYNVYFLDVAFNEELGFFTAVNCFIYWRDLVRNNVCKSCIFIIVEAPRLEFVQARHKGLLPEIILKAKFLAITLNYMRVISSRKSHVFIIIYKAFVWMLIQLYERCITLKGIPLWKNVLYSVHWIYWI